MYKKKSEGNFFLFEQNCTRFQKLCEDLLLFLGIQDAAIAIWDVGIVGVKGKQKIYAFL